MSLSKREFENQQQHEAEAAERAATKQAEFAADLEKLRQSGGATVEDIERLQAKQAQIADDLEILRKQQEGGANRF